MPCINQERKAGPYRVVVYRASSGARFELQKCAARNQFVPGLPGPCHDVAYGTASSVGKAKVKARALLRRKSGQRLGPWRCFD